MVPETMIAPVLIAKENVPAVLPLVEKELAQVVETFALDNCAYSDVVASLYDCTRQLWVTTDDLGQLRGWTVTRITATNGSRRLMFDFLGGKDIDKMLECLPYIEAWARQYDATETIAYARPGLRRKLKTKGFRHVCDLVVKPLQGQVH